MKISPRQYAKLLYEETGKANKNQIEKAIEKIVRVIRDNRDEKKLQKIICEFGRVYREENHIVQGEVVSVKELSSEELESIRKTVAGKFGTDKKKVELAQKIDPSIGGGIILRVENEIWDGSLAGKIEKLKSQLSS